MNRPGSARREKSVLRIYGCSYEEICEIGFDAATKFNMQRRKAKVRGIEFHFTLPEWWKVWKDSGHWPKRGRTGYVMCRHGDRGPYAVGNVHFATYQQNLLEQYEERAEAAWRAIPVSLGGGDASA